LGLKDNKENIMRTWAKWTTASALALAASTAVAADHKDGSDTTADPTSDINDLFTWTNTAKDTVYLAMSFGGTSAPAAPSDKVLYVFHVNRAATPLAAPGMGTDTDLICKFASGTNAECWLGKGATSVYVKGDPSMTAGMSDAGSKLKVHAGLHADPFFFFLAGLNTAIGTVQTAAAGLMKYASGCPKLDAATVTALQGQLTTGAMNGFASNNAQIIVVAVKKDAIPGTGEHFSVWASTNKAM